MMKFAMILMASILLSGIAVQLSHADYNICGEFATDCQPALTVQCPYYCSPEPISPGMCLTKLQYATGAYDICVQTSNPPSGTVLTSLPIVCGIYNALHDIIFILGLLLMILGGALYAGAHVLPGVTRPAIQSYGMGLLIGGLSGIIIALLAPYLLTMLSNIPNIASVCVPV